MIYIQDNLKTLRNKLLPGGGEAEKVSEVEADAAFRAYDQICMAAVSNATIHLSDSHAGVSIGEDGPSQMALEDLAMMRAVCDSTVLYPSDANQTAYLLGQMVDLKGVSYIRTTREKTTILYPSSENSPSAAARSSSNRVRTKWPWSPPASPCTKRSRLTIPSRARTLPCV